MANKMLIDATHPEETRVVVVRGNRVEEFDYESASRKQLRGNIYLAKVTRVEPSLQAAFIEYGGNRHGFLAFSEIHPDYYQIPVADRLALIEEEERAARLAEDEADLKDRRRERSRAKRSQPDQSISTAAEPVEHPAPEAGEAPAAEEFEAAEGAAPAQDAVTEAPFEAPEASSAHHAEPMSALVAPAEAAEAAAAVVEAAIDAPLGTPLPAPQEQAADDEEALRRREAAEGESDPAPILEGDAVLREEVTVTSAPGEDEAPQSETDEDDHAEEDDDEDEDEDEEDSDEASEEKAPEESAREERSDDEEQPRSRRHRGRRHDRKRDKDEDEDEDDSDVDQIDEDEEIEHLGADEDALEEVPERAPQRRARSYKIQEVIRRRQVMLVQVVKEERGNKGAALTTYLSLAGRYSVLMPNTARGGGISRKITNAVDRKRLKEVVQDLEVPEGMGIILRTAGANRTKTEIKRDFEYLLRLWETVREMTLSSTAPSLVYEEGSLIKRAIRDLYNKDIDDIHVAGEEGFREARDFMRMLMPSHAKSVMPYREPQPIFARYGVEQQLDAMFSPVVQLKSGGYIVINPTEALVSIDVNSGRATREHHIEDTALKTNLEASEEIARQLRLRDLAGLIVIDFIDMEEKRNNRSVERKLKDCLKNDRARIQIGRISHFGLLEMSRQRIRTGVLESSIEVCPHCGGTGHVRSAASVSLQLLRALEEQLLRSQTHNLVARTRTEVALYVLNQKRAHLRELEERFSVTLSVAADESVTGHQPFIIEKGDLAAPAPAAPRPSTVVQPDSILPDEDFLEEDEEEIVEEAETEAEAEAEASEGNGERSDDAGRKRRRRRRRRRGDREEGRESAEGAEGEEEDDTSAEAAEAQDGTRDENAREDDERDDEERGEDERADGERSDDENGDRRRRRRGRRGGRRNRRERDDDAPGSADGESDGSEESDDEQPMAAEAEVAAASVPSPTFAEAPAEARAEPVAEVPAAPAPAPEPVAESAEAAPRRRRSTIREKAPVILSEGGIATPVAPVAAEAPSEPAAEPAPEAAAPEAVAPEAAAPAPAAEPAPAPETPAAPAEETTPPAKPRSGWWQRKLFGG